MIRLALFGYVLLSVVADVPMFARLAIGPIPVVTSLYAVVIGAAILSVLSLPITGCIAQLSHFGLLLFAATCAISVVMGQAPLDIVREAGHYLLAVYGVVLLQQQRVSARDLSLWIALAATLGAVVSILYAYRVIDIGYETSLDFVRAFAVEGGIGLTAILIGTHVAVFATHRWAQSQAALLLISGLIVLILGESRSRLILAGMGVTAILVVSVLRTGGHRGRGWGAVAVAFLTTAYLALADHEEGPLALALARFNIDLSTDGNTSFRIEEATRQVALFWERPLVGHGWGASVESGVWNHNMYTSLMSMTGLIGSVPFFLWALVCVWLAFRTARLTADPEAYMGLLLMLAVLALGVGNAGFAKIGALVGLWLALLLVLEVRERAGLGGGGLRGGATTKSTVVLVQ